MRLMVKKQGGDGHDEKEQRRVVVQIVSDPGPGDKGVLEVLEILVWVSCGENALSHWPRRLIRSPTPKHLQSFER